MTSFSLTKRFKAMPTSIFLGLARKGSSLPDSIMLSSPSSSNAFSNQARTVANELKDVLPGLAFQIPFRDFRALAIARV